MNIANIDLNLLVVFKSIYETRNLSNTAYELGLTQPTISHALKRLRETFDDELFVRSSKVMIPTQKALDLGPFISLKLNELNRGLFDDEEFEPMTSKKEFTLSGTAFDSTILFPELLKDLKEKSPLMTFTFRSIVLEQFFARMQGAQVDLSFAANLKEASGFHIESLSEQDLCLIVRKQKKSLKSMSLKRYLEYEHVIFTPTEKVGSLVDTELAKIGKKRTVNTRTPYLTSIPWIVIERDLAAIVPLSFAKKMAVHLPLSILTPPIELPSFNHQMVWHKSLDNAQEHQWLRAQIRENYPRFMGS
ncbi:LysR family transcriptional regulator [Halobacteriovorax sp. GB3]|uniref:LysR family transcriptional regulator n=1 Tax=Halobacteriovorax sp. GB3 TaxID=2719615 RepID=UPI00235E1EEB|nr:LysR family transcriptional regulator [Halobacteriovorax sp. GB3]MDD0852971.1 LysR family transcriptional regulator [Halobacteriovorax sp. GB3]